ncbi:MAG: hypothetical protein LBP22_00985 [Deltaproteobacteria bacterium]|jgi:hypothetical protein|nr:hypothetical protein [Deltaproteobacteria bacterium]
MKKLLVFALAAMLGMAMAMPAQAQSKVQFSGWYRVLHHNLVNFGRAWDKDQGFPAGYESDSFFEHRLNVNVDFRPTDDVLIHWTLRAPNFQRWGAGSMQQGTTNAATVWTRAIYATITQDWGTFSIGRLEETFPTSMNGLKTLGYSYGTTYIYANPFDYKDVADGMVYNYQWDNGFGINVYYAKYATQDPDNATANLDADVDYDRFGVEPTYKWESGAASINIEYDRDMRDRGAGPTVKDYAFFVNPAIMQSWGDFSIRFEGKIGWGKREITTGAGKRTSDLAGLGAYLQATYKYSTANHGSGDINIMGWYADGSSRDEMANPFTQKQHDLVTMGDFAPFLVAYYNTNLPNRVRGGATNGIDNGIIGRTTGRMNDNRNLKGSSNHWGIGLLGNHNFTDTIRFNWGIGHFRLVEQVFPGQSKEIGTEIDVGIRIGLMKSVTFESQFGYMFNGKAYERNDGTADNPRWTADAKDTYAWLNALQFAF